MSSTPLPDAAPTNWVDRFAPRGLRPWLKLGRFDRPAGAWLLLLPGWWGVALASAMNQAAPDWLLLIKIAIGAVVMRAAGCAYNDIVDRDIDAKVARTALRPLPSGQLSVRQAWGFVIAMSLIGLVILLTLKPTAIVLGVVSLGLVAAYPFMKRFTWWPQAWLGLTFNWGVLLGFAAVEGAISDLHPLILYAAGVFWTLGYDTLYAIQDIEDAALAGVKSSARRLGGNVRRGVAIFYALCAGLSLTAGWMAGLGFPFYFVWLFFAAHLAGQAWRTRPGDGVGALHLFRSNRDAGLLLAIALALGAMRWS
jgi:4-hydroxybenzoate polyprenyltransferase